MYVHKILIKFIKTIWKIRNFQGFLNFQFLKLEQIIDEYSFYEYIFIGSPTTSATPCPGNVAFESDGTCPDFMCDADDACKNDGTCDNGSCTCNNGFSGIDCSLGKFTTIFFSYSRHYVNYSR